MNGNYVLASLLTVLVPALAVAQEIAPGDGLSGPPMPPALDAAYGTPPAGADVDPSTTAQPGYVERAAPGAGDRTMGPSTSSVDAEGNMVSGFTVLDESIEFGPAGEIGQTPHYHTVEKGDTLWGISRSYLNDPYAWPRLWSYNEQITNAHWIFPGDRVRLHDPYGRDESGEPQAALEFSKTRIPVTDKQKTWVLNQTAFVSVEEFDSAMDLVGGADAKVMMATLDTVYMDYPKEHPPIPGERLVVYTPQDVVRDIKRRKVLGYVVEIVGEIDVDSVAEKAAEGTVAFALNPLERGYKVGPLQRRYHSVSPAPAARTSHGRVIATLTSTGPLYDLEITKGRKRKTRRGMEHDVLAGEEHWLITDLGSNDGVVVGNVFEVVRKGDAYTRKRIFNVPYEEGWPRRVIGTILVVDVQPETSLGFVTWSEREIERGEHVELGGPNTGGNTAADPTPRGVEGQGRATGEAEAGANPSGIKGKGSVRIGG